MNYYEHHLGDYAEATAHLSFVEDAAYSRCIRKYYSTEMPLPADPKAVQRLIGARSKEERTAVEAVLQEFFTLESDGWHNPRCDEEIARFKDKQSKAKRSADARWTAHRSHSEGTPNAMRTHSEGNALQSPVSNHQTPVKKSSLRSDSARERDDQAFGAVKHAYPAGIYPQSDWLLAERESHRRVEEGAAWDEIRAGVERYARQCEAKGSLGTQFVLSPAKFFAGGPAPKFREPFPLPATKADTRLSGNISAAEEFMRRTEVA